MIIQFKLITWCGFGRTRLVQASVFLAIQQRFCRFWGRAVSITQVDNSRSGCTNAIQKTTGLDINGLFGDGWSHRMSGWCSLRRWHLWTNDGRWWYLVTWTRSGIHFVSSIRRCLLYHNKIRFFSFFNFHTARCRRVKFSLFVTWLFVSSVSCIIAASLWGIGPLYWRKNSCTAEHISCSWSGAITLHKDLFSKR